MPGARGAAKPYFGGSVAERLHDLHAAFADPEVDLLICTRGGYGCNYLLPGLDFDLIRENPKPLLGYSDTTAIQTAILDRTGLVSFHAPMLAADFYLADGVDDASFDAIFSGQTYSYGDPEGLRTLRPGVAQGQLYGGCLTLLAASLGTPWAPQTEGKLLFLEDVGTKPYQVDRLLRQLVLAGKLDGVPGIVFGEMLDCGSPAGETELLQQAILHALGDFHGPIGFGLRSGHVARANVTLPFGVQARFAASAAGANLTLLEPATRTL
jgi:muramoyltetrapeptide carboxypeptidase